ncbi:hypothetical protein [Cutibacterium sp. V947]|uniref:hypothetical protein n=1 Tax=unclassified Cutibacterium TaxID=2649671 RepID=UPI003EE30C56
MMSTPCPTSPTTRSLLRTVLFAELVAVRIFGGVAEQLVDAVAHEVGGDERECPRPSHEPGPIGTPG